MNNPSTISACVVAFMMLWPFPGTSQTFQNLNARFPMGASEVIFQDTEGFLWIGTVNGLVRFDGYETHFYTHDLQDTASIAANNLNAIAQDTAGRIWVGLSAFGLDILDVELKRFTHVCLPDSAGICMQDISVNAFVTDRDDMWVGTARGLMRFTLDEIPQLTGMYRRDPGDPYSLSDDYIMNTFIDSKGRLWVGTLHGINLYDRSRDRFINHRTHETFPSVQILDIAEDREGTVWLSPRFIEACLLVFDEEMQDFIAVTEFRNRQLGEFKITFDQENGLWISSRGVGAFHVDATTGIRTFFDPQHAAFHGYRNVYGLQPITDRYGNVWMTGSHVMKWSATGKAISHLNSNENPVISVYADSDAIWYSENEPRRFQRKTQDLDAFLPEFLPTNIRKEAIDANPVRRMYRIQAYDQDHVIMTTTRSVFMWNTRTDAYKEYPLDYGGPFRDFVIAGDREHIWICGNQGSPILLNLKTGAASRPEISKSILNPRCVAKSENGDLWFGSGSNGVYRLEAGTHKVENFAPDHGDVSHRLTDYSINNIAIARDVVWVATNLGVNRIDTRSHTINYLPHEEDFGNESVMSVLVDDTGDVWMGTLQGLVRYHPETHAFTRFGQSDGLINAVYSQGACYKDSHGHVYFGGDRGLDFFDPKSIDINAILPDLYIGNILVNNAPADTSIAAHHIRKLSLSHSENFIEIELLALHLTAPEANQYAYRIPELDENWRALGIQRTITLANMQPGSYTLQARAANADGIWCADKTVLHITISPPFWATWWFIASCVLVTGALLFYAYRYRIRQVETRERLKSEFNKRIVELESKALRAQMNPHFLFNSVNSVKSLISLGENEKATQYLTQFAQLIRQVLANSEKPFVRLQEELEALRLYLAIEQLRFQNFTYVIQVEDNVNPDFIEVPPLILQPYVENAIWHGLMHKTEDARKLSISVTRDDGFLHMSVEDNGIGRAQAGQMKMRGGTRKGGMGMRLTSDRLNLLHKIYGNEVSVMVEDLYAGGKATGTKVEIRIPYLE